MHSLAGHQCLQTSCRSLIAPAARPCNHRLVFTQAKKGGQKKSAQKKGGSALADLLNKKEQAGQPAADMSGGSLASPDQYKDPEVVIQLMMICQSYWKQYNE